MSKTGLDQSKLVLNGLLKIGLYMGDDIIFTLKGGGEDYSTDLWLHLECLIM